MKKNKPRKSITFFDKLISIKKEIKWAFFISLTSVILIEIWLKNIYSPSNSFFIIGDIYLKVCYSIVATSIFFLINQHLPKEERNLKTNRYIRNKIVFIDSELWYLTETLGIKKRTEITEQLIIDACKKINPAMPVIELRMNKFDDWRYYLKYKTEKIKRLLDEILILNPSIETELLEHIVNMHDALHLFFFLDSTNIGHGKDLTFYSNAIYTLIEKNKDAQKILDLRKYKLYSNTNMNNYRKEKQSATANTRL